MPATMAMKPAHETAPIPYCPIGSVLERPEARRCYQQTACRQRAQRHDNGYCLASVCHRSRYNHRQGVKVNSNSNSNYNNNNSHASSSSNRWRKRRCNNRPIGSCWCNLTPASASGLTSTLRRRGLNPCCIRGRLPMPVAPETLKSGDRPFVVVVGSEKTVHTCETTLAR